VRALVVLAVVFLALTPAAAAAPPVLQSGALEARVSEAPFGLELKDRRDGDVLRTLGGDLPRPEDPRAKYGPLGYSFDLRVPVVNNAFLGYYVAAEVETLWFHGTRVRGWRQAGRALVLDVDTNDPLGHRLEVTLAPVQEGSIRVRSRIAPGSGPLADRASVSGAAFAAAGDERYLGFGERSNAADQTGNRVFSWAEEGPFSSGDYERNLRPLVPDFTFPTGPTASNFPIPWLLSTRGFGFLIDQTERSTFDLVRERRDAWHAQAEAPELRFTVFAGPRPSQALRRYSQYAGRQPRPEPWFFGPWFQPTLERQPFELADRFRSDDVPVTVAQTYTHYLPCGAHKGREREERERVAGYHSRGFKITTYFNPHVCLEYQPVYGEAAANGWLVKNRAGQPYVLSNPFTADEQVSEIDFTHPGARGFFHRLLDEAITTGYDGWMEDFGEYTPTDAVFANGKGGLEMHNRYPVIYHAASTEHTTRRGGDFAVYVRSGFHGVQPHARVVWGGDPTEDWSCSDGLCAALHQALSIGLSGVAYWGSDIGGFHSIVNPRTSDELNVRWLQLGAVSGIMRTQANGFSFRDDRARRSQVWSPNVAPIWRRYSKLRTQLYPYIAGAVKRYHADGMPISRHLALVWPNDEQAVRRQDEMMFGPDILAAPVLTPDTDRRTLYLPPGRWIDLWRSARFEEKQGTLQLGSPHLLDGDREVTVPAPLEELPLFVRAGAMIGMLPPDVDTLAPEGGGAGLVRMRDRARRVRILAFPRGRSTRWVAPGVRVRSLERRGMWTLRVRSRHRQRLQLEASFAMLRRPFRPCSVRVGKRRVSRKRWRYDREAKVFHADFYVRGATLYARSCDKPRARR
jgi:sulfoquinovosidase